MKIRFAVNEVNVCFCFEPVNLLCLCLCDDDDDDEGDEGDVMYYGVYTSQVVCNFSPAHWVLPARSWKRHLASCAVRG